MPCCCGKIINLCNAPICTELELPVVAVAGESPSTTIYKLVLDFFQTQVTIEQVQTPPQKVKFDISMLNENFEYTGKLYDSAGELVYILDNNLVSYDCIKFKTVQNVVLT